MNTERIKITKIKANKVNPRIIKDDKFFKLVDSLLVFPKMLDLRPIVVDIDMTVLGGNMRLRALQHIAKMPESDLRNNLARLKRDDMLDYWLAWQDVKDAPTARASDLNDDEKRQFIIKDNAAFGAWDYDMLANEWDEPDLSAWGIDLPTEWGVKPDDFGNEFSLKNGDKEPFQQMTFTLADVQAEEIKAAIADIKLTSDFKGMETNGNENSNGNALYLIVKQWVDARK